MVAHRLPHPTLLLVLRLILLAAFLLPASGCAWWRKREMMAQPPGIAPETGAEKARDDIAHGKLKLLLAGGDSIHTPGVPPGDPRLEKLPLQSVPAGSSAPYAMQWYEYARAYNAVVVEHVRKQPSR